MDFITELSGLARAAASPPDPMLPRFAVGEWILLYCPDQVSTSLDSEYQGPYRVVFQELDATTNSPTGWFVVREILAGDTEEAPRVGPPIETHSSRMWPFDHSRTTAELEHERRLPPGHHLLERVVEGPDKDGRFLIKWLRLEKPRWEWPTAIAHTAQFKEFCETKGIVMAEGRAVQWRPSNLPPGPATTAARTPRPSSVVDGVLSVPSRRERGERPRGPLSHSPNNGSHRAIDPGLFEFPGHCECASE